MSSMSCLVVMNMTEWWEKRYKDTTIEAKEIDISVSSFYKCDRCGSKVYLLSVYDGKGRDLGVLCVSCFAKFYMKHIDKKILGDDYKLDVFSK